MERFLAEENGRGWRLGRMHTSGISFILLMSWWVLGQVISSLCRLHPSDVLTPVSLPVFPSTAETVCPCRTASFLISVALKQLNRV